MRNEASWGFLREKCQNYITMAVTHFILSSALQAKRTATYDDRKQYITVQ
jgi:hypothetical protein